MEGCCKGAAGTFTIGGALPVFAIQGSVVFTTNKATLTVGVSGTFNVSTGAFSASGPVTDATGKLEGATGSLTLSGVENLATGHSRRRLPAVSA